MLKNIATILEAAGSSLQHVLRCGVFLVDMKEFPKMNEVYARAFGSHRPARTTVEVSGLPGAGLASRSTRSPTFLRAIRGISSQEDPEISRIPLRDVR